MLIGYARTSTIDQQAGYQAQIDALGDAGCEKVFDEQVSSVAKREALETALDYLRDGDTLVVTKLDRLARSTADLIDIDKRIQDRKASLRILDLDLDTSTAQGKLLFTMIGAIAEFERALMLERQREGIAQAKAKGKYKGRKPTARAKAADILKLRQEGLGGSEIARRLGIGRSSVYRVLRAEGSSNRVLREQAGIAAKLPMRHKVPIAEQPKGQEEAGKTAAPEDALLNPRSKPAKAR